MAKKTPKEDPKDIKDKALYDKVVGSKEDSITEYKTVRDAFSEKEALLLGTLEDEYSTTAKSKVNDPRLATITIERSARVMAQHPQGKSMSISDNDLGKNQLMNLTIDKYVLPNANSQWSYLTKSRMWDMYSLVYGTMFQMVDWRVDLKSGYIGPDSFLLPIRDAFPQAGAMSVNDSDKFNTSVLMGINDLEKLDKKSWNHIDELITKLKNKEGISRDDLGNDQKSHVQDERNHTALGNKIEFITEFRTYGGDDKSRGEWITVSPQLVGKVLRRIDNPHKNGELPIVAKNAFPLIDSMYGLGEFERGKTLQYAINSLINLYLDGVKMSIFPPMMINPDGVVRSTIKFGPAAKWLVRSMDAVKQFNINPQGLQTFNSTYSFLIAAILNQAGTTSTTTTDKVDPGMGKTPQALKMQEARGNSRDSWDQFMMDQAQEGILKKFVNLISTKQSSKITMRLFEDEIEKIKITHPDVTEFIEGNELSVKSDKFKGSMFDYQVVPGSTAQIDEEAQFQALSSTLNSYLQFPQLAEALAKKGKELDVAEVFTRMIAKSKVQDWNRMIVNAEPPSDREDAPPPPGIVPPSVAGQGQPPQPQQAPPQAPPQAPDFQDEATNAAAQEIMSIMGGPGSVPPNPGG